MKLECWNAFQQREEYFRKENLKQQQLGMENEQKELELIQKRWPELEIVQEMVSQIYFKMLNRNVVILHLRIISTYLARLIRSQCR